MKTRKDEIRGLDWYARNPHHWLEGVRNLTPEQRGIYDTILDTIYATGDRCEDHDPRMAVASNCHVRVYRRVKAELIAAGKLSLEDGGDGLVYIRNETATKEVVKGRSLVEQAVVNGSLGGQTSAHNRRMNTNKNKGPAVPPARPPAAPPAQHLNSNSNKNTTDRRESGAARAPSAAHPEGRAEAATPTLDQHQESAVRAFASLFLDGDAAAWETYGATIEKTPTGFLVQCPSVSRRNLVVSRFSTKLNASLKRYTIKTPDNPDISVP